jgi:hypothetical protein
MTMNKLYKITLALSMSALALGCPSDDGGGTGDGTADDDGGTVTPPTTGVGDDDDDDDGATVDDTADGATTATDGGTATDDGTDSGTTAVDPGPFVPDDPDPTLYTRVDQVGMPAVNTALIAMANKDAYNQATQTQIGMNPFDVDRFASISFLLDGLADDLGDAPPDGLGLDVCDDPTQCNNQARPLIVPDALDIDTTADAAFPNGRLLTDPVIDITMAVLLLDLGVESPTTFVGAVNPTENDVAFQDEFPFLADPH